MLTELSLLLDFAAAFCGLMIAVALLAQERFGWTRARLELGGAIFGFSLLLAFFVLFDQRIVPATDLIVIAINIVGLTAAALFLNYVRGAVAWGAWPAIAFLPAGLYFVTVIFWPAPRPLWILVDLVVGLHIAITVAAIAIYLWARRAIPSAWRTRRENRHLPLFITGMCVLHVAQILRLVFPDNAVLYDVVPLTGAVGLLALSAYALLGSQNLRMMVAPRARVPANLQKDDSILERLRERQSYLDPDVSLPRVAAELDMPARDLSGALNSTFGRSFREVINDLRIEEAKRLLTTPEEASTSIEAIALLSGFRSRSAFYDAFRQRTGKTPAAFREGATGA